MKKFVLFLFTVFCINSAHAQVNTGGFEGPDINKNNVTVEQALKMSDETRVVIVGQIVNSLGDEKYTFKDSTGEVIVEIDDEDWNGLKVKPENVIEITGEVDKELMETTKIDVDLIVIKK